MRILNIGCYNDTYGTDFVDLYPQRKEVRKCNIDTDKLPYENETFDEVCSNFVFEHLNNPKHYFEECRRVLKPGGRLVLATDNASCIIFHIPRTPRYQHIYNDGASDDRHFAIFFPLHLKSWAERFGFEDAKVEYVYGTSPKVRLLKPLLSLFEQYTAYGIRLTATKK